VRLPEPSADSLHQGERLCPSARCEEGAILLGIVGRNGQVGYVTPRITVDAEFVREARKGRAPEARFRFAQPCVEGRCAQWTSSRCGLIDKVIGSPEASRKNEWSQESLPECVIRPSCRWFGQEGAKACAVCPLVVHTAAPL
jgi:hypothetical protein